MQALTKHLKRFKRANRGISTVIMATLSLVLVVIIVGNVVLWSYQMNQFDLDRMHETLSLTNVTRITRSPWIDVQNEFSVSSGSRLSGTYTDTINLDGSFETFREELQGSGNYYPSDYVLGGSTSHVSGDIADLDSKDDGYMNFRSYPNYEVSYQEDLTLSSTTNTAYQDKITLNFTPQLTGNFMIIATAEVQGSSTSYQAKAKLTVNATTYQELAYRVKDTSDWYPFDGLKGLNLLGDTNYEIKLQFCTNNAGGTAYIRNARILILSLQHEYAESETLSTTTNTSWQDKTALTFTPPSSGDYLIISTANYQGSSTSRDVYIRLIQDGTLIHADTSGQPGTGTTANFYTFGVMRRVTLDESQHDFRIQFRSSASSGTAGINYAHIVAIRLDQFDSNHYVEDETESAPAVVGEWADKIVNAYSADDGSYLILGSTAYKSGNTNNAVGLDFQTESTSRQSPLVEHRNANDYESTFFMTKRTLTAGSKTDSIRWMGEHSNARVKSARLISCELPAPTQTAEVEFSGKSNTQDWTRLEWAADLSFTQDSVPTTLQIYNYNTSQYPTSGDGYITALIGQTDTTENQTIINEPTYFRDVDTSWRMKITATKSTSTQFEVRIDWAEFTTVTSDYYRLDFNNDYSIDLSIYPRSCIKGIEMLVRYNVTEAAERWFLKAYNWSAASFSDEGFNVTGGNQPALGEWNDYAVTVTDGWADYVNDEGVMRVEFSDEGLTTNQTTVGVDFLSVTAIIDGTRLDIKNSSPLSLHIVAVWITNSTYHKRYDVDLFMNSGETASYLRADISLPENDFVVKVVTERGNEAVF